MSDDLAASELATLQSSPTPAPVPQGQVTDVRTFIEYLKQFVPVLLDANNNSGSVEFEKCLSERANQETIKKFLGEAQVRTLIIQKFVIKGKLQMFFFYWTRLFISQKLN